MFKFFITVLVPIVAAFIISVVAGKFLIPVLTKLKVGNTEREELESHQVKNGTPSMGGLMFLIAIVVVSAFYIKDYPLVLPIAVTTLLFGVIGFIDDYLKTIKRDSDGLLAWQKFLLQMVVATALCMYIIFKGDISLQLLIPFAGTYVDIGWLSVPLFYLAVLGTVNGVNFTDGVDGLASSVTIVVAAFFTCAAAALGGGEVAPVACAVIGALMGFLVYNVYPAKIFMGDTGSLALGGFVAATAYVLQMPLFIIIVGFIYLGEVLSVIIQVLYFKATHGKRIFPMTPIHHSFELKGWSEAKVVCVFTIVTVILCVIGYTGVLGAV
ncbi:MAG: phospho-N-acetylmuramoyl-pentapeptide-transferase [Lachnospiraceae bacterium]|nr:phospho-N-acetylmuramoyl-pentapeptide-transferase [Lachnospiraceae bacterium]